MVTTRHILTLLPCRYEGPRVVDTRCGKPTTYRVDGKPCCSKHLEGMITRALMFPSTAQVVVTNNREDVSGHEDYIRPV